MMDIPCEQWQDHVARKWGTLDPEMKNSFASLLDIDDVFKFALGQTMPEDLEFLQGISKAYPVRKDTEQATQWREKGNSSFKARDYTAATLHYSQGVCFATQRSEQLSLCYANRSAALYHLRQYQESLDDIARALKHGYPSHLRHKLKDRRMQCLNKLSVTQPTPASKDHIQSGSCVNNDTDSSFCVAPQVAICVSPEKGRHLVATESIAAGQLILKDRPYCSVLIPGTEKIGPLATEERRCHHCLQEAACPVPCRGCSYSRYCSSGCRQEAWEEYHRWECPIGAQLMALGVMSHLALRVSIKAGLTNVQRARELVEDQESDSSPLCPPNKCSCVSLTANGDSYASVYHLLHHLNHHSPSLRFLCAVTMATLHSALRQAGPPPGSWDPSGSMVMTNPSGEEEEEDEEEEEEGGTRDWQPDLWLLGSVALRHLLQLKCNAQAITALQDTGVKDSQVQATQEIRIATAVFPMLSLLNHSCCPNTSLVFCTGASVGLSQPACSGSERSANVAGGGSAACGIAVLIRAAKTISTGQEVLHCYGPHSSRMAACERQRLLQEQYYFLCGCEACSRQQEGRASEGVGQQLAAHRPEDGELLCAICRGPLKKCKDTELGFICALASCGQSMASSEARRRLQDIRGNIKTALDLLERDRLDEALRLLQRTVSQDGRILTESHPLQGAISDAMARVYATMGDWNSAAFQLERSAVAIGFQYGEDSIELGQQLFKLAQLHFNGGARRQALTIIPRVRRLLCLHCGPQCPELEELQAMEDCLRG